MCSINHDLKAIYIHVPKCGGVFVENILRKYYDFESIVLNNEKHKNFIFQIDDTFEKVVQNDSDEPNEDDFEYCMDHKGYGDCWSITEHGILRYTSSSKLYNYAMEMTEEKWRDYKKFTIIRNPYDKFISAWKFINKCIKQRKMNAAILTLDEYINKYKTELYDYCKFAYSHSHITTYDHLLDVNDELNIDYIGSLENLNEDLCNILLKIGVDKIKHRKELEENKKYNATEHAAYVEYYDDNTLEKVNEILQKDFDTFKQYKQVYSIEEMKKESTKYLISNDEFNKKNVDLIQKLKDSNQIEQ
jgi:hypothetical protein